MVANKCVGFPGKGDGFIVSCRAFAKFEGWKSDAARYFSILPRLQNLRASLDDVYVHFACEGYEEVLH